MNTGLAVIKCVKQPPKRRYLYGGQLSQNITTSKMEEFCVEKNAKLLHIRQILKSEAQLKAFFCVCKFDEEKVGLPDLRPENDTVSNFTWMQPPMIAKKSWIKIDY